MTAIADRAGSSIGGPYRYFPDKQTLAIALLKQYVSDFDEVWTSVLAELADVSVKEFAAHLIDKMGRIHRRQTRLFHAANRANPLSAGCSFSFASAYPVQ
jgi:AcrR family transcriptional regulator